MRKNRSSDRSGFSILELLLVIAIIAIIAIVTMGVASNSIGRSQLRQAEAIIIQTARRAQTLSQNNVDDRKWGIYICNDSDGDCCDGTCAYNSVILFSRPSADVEFDDYDSAADQVIEYGNGVTPSGTLYTAIDGGYGIMFDQITGKPKANGSAVSGDLTLSDAHGETRTVTLNAQGVME